MKKHRKKQCKSHLRIVNLSELLSRLPTTEKNEKPVLETEMNQTVPFTDKDMKGDSCTSSPPLVPQPGSGALRRFECGFCRHICRSRRDLENHVTDLHPGTVQSVRNFVEDCCNKDCYCSICKKDSPVVYTFICGVDPNNTRYRSYGTKSLPVLTEREEVEMRELEMDDTAYCKILLMTAALKQKEVANASGKRLNTEDVSVCAATSVSPSNPEQ